MLFALFTKNMARENMRLRMRCHGSLRTMTRQAVSTLKLSCFPDLSTSEPPCAKGAHLKVSHLLHEVGTLLVRVHLLALALAGLADSAAHAFVAGAPGAARGRRQRGHARRRARLAAGRAYMEVLVSYPALVKLSQETCGKGTQKWCTPQFGASPYTVLGHRSKKIIYPCKRTSESP